MSIINTEYIFPVICLFIIVHFLIVILHSYLDFFIITTRPFVKLSIITTSFVRRTLLTIVHLTSTVSSKMSKFPTHITLVFTL